MTFFSQKHPAAFLFVGIFLFLAVPLASPQSTASIQGTVTDQSVAIVTGATVLIRNVATGETRTVDTDDAGNYLVPSLIPGPYTVQVSANGMQSRLLQGNHA